MIEYSLNDEKLKEIRSNARELCYLIDSINPKEKDKKKELFRKLIPNIKGDFTIHRGFNCDYGINIFIDENFYANYNLTILDCAKVIIGKNVMIGPNCSIITPTHPIDVKSRLEGIEMAQSIIIGDNVWIASNVTIMPGVNIGDNTVIGANSLVTKNIPANVVAYGNPCRVQKKLK